MATLADIAAKAGVSKATASRVLSGKTGVPVSPETVARIRQAAAEAGYTPNRLAAALATGRTNMIAVLLPVLDRPYYSAIIGHIERLARADGYELLITCVRPGSDLRRLAALPADGCILCELYGVGEPIIAAMQKRGAVVGLSGQTHSTMDSVVFDMDSAVADAIGHMVEQGCRRIGYLTVPPTIRPEYPRWHGYQKVLGERGMEPLPLLIDAERRNLARDRIIEALEQYPDMDGLFCHTDHLALGAMRGIVDSGRRVPEDITVAGCDNTEEGEFCEPPLSTISLPLGPMCEHAWRLIRRRLCEPEAPVEHLSLPATFVVRRSTLRHSHQTHAPSAQRALTGTNHSKGGTP
ncbi:MAG: LacI family transcriptional regulator [Chthonomonadales bacterium]|nr:LacI family transcriptional regulator [Chthonomonadales bacterium]